MSAQEARYDYGYDYLYESNAAPQIKEQPQTKKVQFEVIENPLAKEIAKQKRHLQLFIKTTACICVSAVILCCTAITGARRESANRSLEEAKNKLHTVQEANRMLNVELNAIIANVNIDQIATEELGLVKVSSENEHYLSIGNGNRVIFSANEQ